MSLGIIDIRNICHRKKCHWNKCHLGIYVVQSYILKFWWCTCTTSSVLPAVSLFFQPLAKKKRNLLVSPHLPRAFFLSTDVLSAIVILFLYPLWVTCFHLIIIIWRQTFLQNWKFSDWLTD